MLNSSSHPLTSCHELVYSEVVDVYEYNKEFQESDCIFELFYTEINEG